MTITLVTGATGLIGNNIVRMLLQQQQAVRVLVRSSSDPRPLDRLAVEVVAGDVRSEADVRRATDGVGRVIHAAAYLQIGHSQLELSRAINVTGTRHVAAAARDAGIRMLHVSTVDTLGVGRPDRLATEDEQYGEKAASSYSRTKREAERIVEDEIARGLDALIVHPVFTIGPWDWKPSSGRMILAVARKFTPLAPSGGMTVADSRDVAQGIISALHRGQRGEHYILGGQPMPYLDFWRLCAEVTGGSPPLCRMGPLNRIIAGRAGDLWGRLTGREGDVNSASIAVSSQWHYYSSQKAESCFAYRARPVRQSVEAAWDWLKDFHSN